MTASAPLVFAESTSTITSNESIKVHSESAPILERILESWRIHLVLHSLLFSFDPFSRWTELPFLFKSSFWDSSNQLVQHLFCLRLDFVCIGQVRAEMLFYSRLLQTQSLGRNKDLNGSNRLVQMSCHDVFTFPISQGSLINR